MLNYMVYGAGVSKPPFPLCKEKKGTPERNV
jgi:hypothetical protein